MSPSDAGDLESPEWNHNPYISNGLNVLENLVAQACATR